MAKKKRRSNPGFSPTASAKSNTTPSWTTILAEYQAGRLESAEAGSLAILESEPNRVEVLLLLALITHQRQQFESAIAYYRRVLSLNPNEPQALNNLGSIFRQQGELDKAIATYQKAIEVQPNYADAYYNLGSALWQQGQLEAAIIHYQKSLVIKPDLIEAYYRLAKIHQSCQQIDEAIQCYQQALTWDANNASVYNNLGSLFREQKRLTEAIANHQQAITLKPDYPEAYACLGFALQENKQRDEAIKIYHQALALKPDYPEVLVNLGAAYKEEDKLEDALAYYQQAIAINPNLPEAYNNLGAVCKDLDRLTEALTYYQKVLDLKPNDPEALRFIGNVYVDQGNLETALNYYQTSLALKPNDAMTHSALSTALLLQGKLKEGFSEYEWRWKTDVFEKRNYQQPLWDGSPLNGKTLLIYVEQGYGDTIQFIRYLPLIEKQGGKILFETYPPLIKLCEQIPGIDVLITKGAPIPEYDVHTPLLSLPYLLGTTLETIPASIPYLNAETTLTSIIPKDDTLKIGIAWGVNPESNTARKRRCALSYFQQLLEIPGITLYSLQKGEAVKDLAGENRIIDLSSYLTDFVDTANAIASLDLIITVDTAIGHLAGAMGKKAWVMLPFSPDWRWMLHRTDTPWYPTVQLFRQPAPGDWQGVLNQVKQALQSQLQHISNSGVTNSEALRYHQQGCTAQGQGKIEEAIAHYQAALNLDPNLVEAYNNLGAAYWNLGRYEEAKRSYNQAIALKPNYPEAYSNLGVVLWRLGDNEQAIQILEQAIAIKPDHVEAYNNLGAALRSAQQIEKAIAIYRQALKLNPNSPEVCNNLGIALFEENQLEEAVELYQRALQLRSNYPEAYDNLGKALQSLGRMEEAIEKHRTAITLKPDFQSAYNRLGNALQQNGQLEDAIAIYQQAITQDPTHFDALTNLAATYCKVGRLMDAIKISQQAIELKPDDASAHFGLAFSLLLSGNLVPGFIEYEWRWHISLAYPRNFTQPQWQGEDLTGKTILLHGEQGLGDAIQFIRYVSLVKAENAQIIVECQPSLVRLFKTIPTIDQVVAVGDTLPHFDTHAALMSLPRILGTTLETIPAEVPYLDVSSLEASPSLPDFPQNQVKIGFAWSGFPSYQYDKTRFRSCDLNFFVELMNLPGLIWYSLQKEIPESDRTLLAQSPAISLGEQFQDLADTAKAIANLDLVITIDTAIAHLAGAMGKQVWVVLPFAPDWRWLLHREDSPWYPTLRLFRQEQPGDWRGVFTQVLQALKSQWGIQLSPEAIEALHNQGVAACRNNQLEEGIRYYQQVLALQPDHFHANHNLGVAYHKQGKKQEAVTYYRRALQINPNFIEAHSSIGVAYHDLGLLTQALSHLDTAIALNPNFTDAYYNQGNVYLDLGQLAQAKANYQRVFQVEPNHIFAHWNTAIALLHEGNFQQGFIEYEWRWKRLNLEPLYPQVPLWDGSDLQGKTILLYAEQGFGDTIQFIRYLPQVLAKNGRVLLQCQPELKRLLSQIKGLSGIVSSGEPLPYFDVQAPLMSLPRILGTTLETIPQPLAELKPSPQAPHLGSAQPKIGFVWSGNPLILTNPQHYRTCNLELFLELFANQPIQAYSLQKQLTEAEQRLLQQQPNLENLSSKLGDFQDTADYISQLDLVITIDTAVAHLAGTMGKPVWVLLPFSPDWRWMLKRSDSPWYPTLRLFRQISPGQWSEVFGNLRQALAQWLTETSVKVPEPIVISEASQTLFTQGCEAFKQRQIEIAIALLREAVSIQPNYADAHYHLGYAYKQVGNFQSAIDYYQQALKYNPQLIEARVSLGVVLREIGRNEEAKIQYQQALQLNQQHPVIHYNLGNIFQIEGEKEKAIAHYRQAVQLKPDYLEALTNLGFLLQETKQYDESVEIYHRLLKLDPNSISGYTNLGVVLQFQDKLEEAATCYQTAIKLNPDFAIPYNNLGLVLQAWDRIVEAAQHHEKAISLQADYADAHHNLGVALMKQCKIPEAIASYQRAITLKPDFVAARIGIAINLMLLGDFAQGFAEYEWRWQLPDNPPPGLPQPMWDGSSLQGKTIFIYSEQGFGDTLQFIRYAPLLKAQGARIIAFCQRELVRLLQTVPGIDHLAAWGDPLPAYDVRCPLLSLPRFMGTTVETIPANIPYFHPPVTKQLPPPQIPVEKALKIGIVWAGSPTHKDDRTRSCGLGHFLTLLDIPGTIFYSLQKGPRTEDLKTYTVGKKLIDLSDQIQDFADTAAFVSQLDLVIAVDTSIVHLAAGLGKPVWVCLCSYPDWRWLLNRDDSPWYPTVRLFRQPEFGDWQSVFSQVRQALSQWVKEGKPEFEVQTKPIPTIHEAVAKHQAGQFAEAKAMYQQILNAQPTFAEAWQLLGAATCQMGNPQESIAYFQKALSLKPDYPDAYNNMGAAYGELQQVETAIANYRQAIALKPDYADAYNNLGTALRQQSLTQEAIECYKTSIQYKADNPEAHNNLALAYRDLLQIENAIAHYEKAIALRYHYPEAHTYLALSLLLIGNFPRGLAEYEWRWAMKGFATGLDPNQFWNGSALPGKTILLRAEQGFGDTIQFIRYAPMVKALCGKVIVECQGALKRWLQTAPGVDQIIARGEEAVPLFDAQIPLLSLPRVLNTTVDNIPAKIPYLSTQGSEWGKEAVQIITQTHKPLKVGIVWAGSPGHLDNQRRSCGLKAYLPLLELSQIQFFTLQKGEPAQEAVGVENLISLDPYLNDFADTASAIAQLDLVITIDTSVAHVAGALGKPVWVLLCYSADWRWLLDKADTAWYPTMRLFRQPSPGDWTGVFTQVKAALQEKLGSNKPAAVSTPKETPQATQNQPLPFKAVGIGWSIGLASGWGVYGLNLTLQLLKTKGVEPALIMPPSAEINQLNPLHQTLLQPTLQAQQNLQQVLTAYPGQGLAFDMPVLHALGNHVSTAPDIARLRGKPTIGVIFFEDTQLNADALARAQSYDLIVAGSTWNAQVLQSYGLKNVKTVLQGIDPTLFHPAPKSGFWRDRFVIFSGGKLEYRKGQDIVIAAFKRFHQRHPEALLLTAWHNFWPQFMTGLDQTGNVIGLPQVNPDRRLNITQWLLVNGIPSDAVIDIGPIPNYLVAQMIREADVAVFTNRCEGGTNLAAMECLACGVPTILSANTGHLDLINEAHCYPLKTQTPVKPTPIFNGISGWGESEVEEVVAALEQVYNNRSDAEKRGLAAAQFMQNLTWENQVQRFLQALV